MERREYPQLPMVGVGALIHKNGRILLVKRRNEPNKGKWAFPGGLVELGERVEDALIREVREEVGLRIKIEGLLDVIDDIHYDSLGKIRFHYILIDYIASPIGGKIKLNPESSSYGWFYPKEIGEMDTSINTKKAVREFEYNYKSSY